MHTYQCQDHVNLVLKDLGSMRSHESSVQKVWSDSIFQDPGVPGGIPAIMSFLVHEVGKEINILQRRGQVELVVLIQGRI